MYHRLLIFVHFRRNNGAIWIAGLFLIHFLIMRGKYIVRAVGMENDRESKRKGNEEYGDRKGGRCFQRNVDHNVGGTTFYLDKAD